MTRYLVDLAWQKQPEDIGRPWHRRVFPVKAETPEAAERLVIELAQSRGHRQRAAVGPVPSADEVMILSVQG
jgi:hypothetical protein